MVNLLVDFRLCFKAHSNTRTRRAAKNSDKGTFSRLIEKQKSKTLVNETDDAFSYIILFYAFVSSSRGNQS